MKKLLFALLILGIGCKEKSNTLFTALPSSETHITFNNIITENDSINPMDMEFLYNGGGVAVGDFNNDSLPDLYFTASQVPNKLYLNEGKFRFKDITTEAGVTGEGRWSNAASVVDINNDGWQDLYVCTTIKRDPNQRANLLYINQGKQSNGIPVFKEMAKEYGLADTNLSVHAAFFDYDNDGDLDMYLVNTKLAQRKASRFDGGSSENKLPLSDKLFRNDGLNSQLGHPFFTDVSAEAGIRDDGYGLGVAIADINQDGWKDIYVTNDFFTSDLLYINQKNGTFSNTVRTSMKHTSQNAMGNDVADFNNDGMPDLMSVDMNPEDNYRKKKNMNDNNYYLYQSMSQGNVMLQYVRNTLQLNNGNVKDTNGLSVPVFSDISFLAGVAETDWSWSSLFADFDNDGNKDLFITNGYPKDVTDHDFAFFRSYNENLLSKEALLKEIPQIKIPNYAFHNTGTLRFENITNKWGFSVPSFSCGAAYVDLDNDGDLDYVVSNIDDEAFVYQNHSREENKDNFLNLRFKGGPQNLAGLGATAELYYNGGNRQVFENSPYRGYLSCMDASVHFGLGKSNSIDSLIIRWPGGKLQKINNPGINQVITVDIAQATTGIIDSTIVPAYFTDITNQIGLRYYHAETDYIDFDVQRLLPHKLSEYGPALAAGDVDGNGLDDLFVGASYGQDAAFLLQQANGSFAKRELPLPQRNVRKPETMGVLLFDADQDGDLDLYATSGSDETIAGSKDYQDRFFRNDGKGNFSYDSAALPLNTTSKSCVKAVDFDQDGDLDLFVGGRLIPSSYPLPASSFIFRNDTRDGIIRFTDITKTVAPGLDSLGLVCDALWSDYDNDGWPDLVLAGEWMPLTLFHNDKGKFRNASQSTGVQQKLGWWNSLAAGDFDNDGDIDYIAGNLGENSFYRADSLHPVHIYSADFSKSGRAVIIPTLYLPDRTGQKKEYTAHNRDDFMSQLPAMKKDYLTYKSFGEASINDLFKKEELDKAFKVTANYFTSVYMENKGNGVFEYHPLPQIAQIAPLNGMIVEDVNADGFLDLVISGNDFGTEVGNGRFDGLNGLLLLGNGKGGFSQVPLAMSGFFVPGNARALVKMRGPNNQYLLAASQNRSWLKTFRANNSGVLYGLLPGDKEVYYTLKSGKTRKEELYQGNGYLSQSANFICGNPSITKIEVVNSKGVKRTL